MTLKNIQIIDLDGAAGRMVVSVMFGLAEIELEYRKERQAAGIRVARKQGVYTGCRKGTTKGKPMRARALKDQEFTVPIRHKTAISQYCIFRPLILNF